MDVRTPVGSGLWTETCRVGAEPAVRGDKYPAGTGWADRDGELLADVGGVGGELCELRPPGTGHSYPSRGGAVEVTFDGSSRRTRMAHITPAVQRCRTPTDPVPVVTEQPRIRVAASARVRAVLEDTDPSVTTETGRADQRPGRVVMPGCVTYIGEPEQQQAFFPPRIGSPSAAGPGTRVSDRRRGVTSQDVQGGDVRGLRGHRGAHSHRGPEGGPHERTCAVPGAVAGEPAGAVG